LAGGFGDANIRTNSKPHTLISNDCGEGGANEEEDGATDFHIGITGECKEKYDDYYNEEREGSELAS
jgi:hypothetical protein